MTFREQLVENIIKEYILIYNLTVEQQHAILERVPSLTDRELMDEMRNIVKYYSTVSQAYQVGFTSVMHEVEKEKSALEEKNARDTLDLLP